MILFNFILLQVVVFAVVIFFLKKVFYGDTQSAISRLEGVNSELLKKQKELTAKIEAAEKEYGEKKQEAEEITDKLKTDAMTEARKQQDEMVKKAKEQSDEMLQKAKASTEKHYKAVELQVKQNLVDQAAALLNGALSDEMTELVHHGLIKEFLKKGESMDLTAVGGHIDQLVIKAPLPLDKEETVLLESLVKGKLNRDIKIELIEDKSVLAGMVLQFGTLLVDAGLSNYIREQSSTEKEDLKHEKSESDEHKV
jgi:F-type H+-transporting ATPase subunit b